MYIIIDKKLKVLFLVLLCVVSLILLLAILSINSLVNNITETTIDTSSVQPNYRPSPNSQNNKIIVNELSEESVVIEVIKRVNPSVVSIIVTKDLPKFNTIDPFGDFFNDDFFRGFRIQIPQRQQDNNRETEKIEVGGGSGFVISKDGLILTNRHVVADENAEYTVVTTDNKKYPAKVLARDTINDLAIIKINVKGLPVVALGYDHKVELGQSVIAIGNALGEFRNTVSKGVISGLSRSINASSGFGKIESLRGVIQTDAAINSGNSGGPLLNLKGEVIGINTAIAHGAQNIGFAIPISEAKQLIQSVLKYGRIVRPFLGVRYILINKNIAKSNQLPVEYGALVIRGEQATDLAVMPGSPADKTGITENTIILEVDGKKITEDNPLALTIANSSVGKEINLKILQKGKEKIVKVKLTESK